MATTREVLWELKAGKDYCGWSSWGTPETGDEWFISRGEKMRVVGGRKVSCQPGREEARESGLLLLQQHERLVPRKGAGQGDGEDPGAVPGTTDVKGERVSRKRIISHPTLRQISSCISFKFYPKQRDISYFSLDSQTDPGK